MRSKLVRFLIVAQLIAIILLSWKIADKFLRNHPAVAPLSSQTVHSFEADGLKHFYEPKKNVTIGGSADWLPGKVEYTINADTLNERFNYVPQKNERIWRIVTLGDSFTYGQGVNTAENWTELLEDKLNSFTAQCKKIDRVEVINLGLDGYDIPYEVERYKLRGQKYDPDLLLWMVIDPTRLKDEMTSHINECAKNFPYDNSKTLSRYIDCWAQAEKLLMDRYGKAGIQSKLAKSFNSIFNYYHKNIIVLDLLKNHGSIIKKSDKVSIVDSFSIAKYYAMRDPNNKYFLYDGHPNKEGHKMIADDVLNYLTHNNLIPCD